MIKHFTSKKLQEPLCCSCSMRPSIVIKKDNTSGQHSSSLVLNKGIELQHALHIAGDSIVLGLFRAHYALRTATCDVMGILDIAQHIWAKLHLILTVVLISRNNRTLKENSPRIFLCIASSGLDCVLGCRGKFSLHYAAIYETIFEHQPQQLMENAHKHSDSKGHMATIQSYVLKGKDWKGLPQT